MAATDTCINHLYTFVIEIFFYCGIGILGYKGQWTWSVHLRAPSSWTICARILEPLDLVNPVTSARCWTFCIWSCPALVVEFKRGNCRRHCAGHALWIFTKGIFSSRLPRHREHYACSQLRGIVEGLWIGTWKLSSTLSCTRNELWMGYLKRNI